jgi:Protein related to penicillin acylase
MKRSLTLLAVVVAVAAGAGYWYVHGKLPQREGEVAMAGLQAPVSVRYDARGVPHLQAQSEADLYRALGYVHAQDRLFQMEIMRRLARGELAEVLGDKLLPTDTLFRSLRIREQAALMAQRQDHQSPAWQALQAYLEGVNAWQASHPKPMEFDLIGITPRPFTAEDTLSIAGYLAYSFAAAFRTEPALTYIRDQLGPQYLKIFDLDWQPQGALGTPLAAADWQSLEAVARASHEALVEAGIPQFEGSNAWAVSGSRTRSGKPLLAGDPHISFAVPAVWYEAELSAPGFNLYGYFQALNPFAMLGHNRDFGWSLTMLQNDDVDLIAEKTNPANADQVMVDGQWRTLEKTEQQIAVKGEQPVTISLRRSPHGPIVNEVPRRDGRDHADCHVVGVPRNREPDPRRLLPAQSRRHPGQDARSGSQGAGTGAEFRLGQCPWRYRLVGGGEVADPPGRCEPGVHPRRRQQPGRQTRFLPVQRQPAAGEPGQRLYRLGQLPATGRGADTRLLQPSRPRPPARSPTGQPRGEMGHPEQPGVAARYGQ